MSFWNLTDGSAVASSEAYEAPSVEIEPIPKNTVCNAVIEEAKWDDYEGDRYISLKWRVMAPQDYANRVIFHKLKLFGTSRCKDPARTADNAKRMFAVIDHNAGGKLRQIATEPTDEDLMGALMGKRMGIRCNVWSMKQDDGTVKKGNWIDAVSAPQNLPSAPPAPPVQQQAAPQQPHPAHQPSPYAQPVGQAPAAQPQQAAPAPAQADQFGMSDDQIPF